MRRTEFEGELVHVSVGQETDREPYNVALHFRNTTEDDKELSFLMGKRVRIMIEEISEEGHSAKTISNEEAARRLGIPQMAQGRNTTEQGISEPYTEDLTIEEVRERIKEAEGREKDTGDNS